MLTDEFKRELRYIVLKVSDMLEHLDRWQYQDVLNLAKRLSDGRNRNGKPPLECVVVESDWPEYETVWKMIEARVAGRAIEAEVLQSCHSQNAIPAPQDALQSAEAMQAQEPVALSGAEVLAALYGGSVATPQPPSPRTVTQPSQRTRHDTR